MKKIYTLFFFLCTWPFLSAQNNALAERSGQSSAIEFKIYPNPVTDGFVNISTTDLGPKQVFIYDVFGIEVLSERLTENKVIDISGLDKGVYILRLISQNKVATRKLIVK